MRKEQSAAVVTIKDAARMTKRGKKAIADWLRRCAKFVEKDGEAFAGVCRMRYLYR